jgi:ComF family protein
MEFSQEYFLSIFQRNMFSFVGKAQQLRIKLSCCDLCGGACQSQALLCDFCSADLPFFDLTSLQGNLLFYPTIHAILPRRKFDRLVAVSPYMWPVDAWVRQLKYHGRFEVVNLLGSLLFQQWQKAQQAQKSSPASLVIAVPIHLNKWQCRGFNQAHLLANNFAKKAMLTYLPNALLRISDNKSQAGQTGTQRRKNLRQVFELSPELRRGQHKKKALLPEHILLIDDVITTGSTCNEICRVLKRHGVKEVTVLTLCLSLPETQILR